MRPGCAIVGAHEVMKNLRKRLNTSVDELDSTRLQKGYGAEGVCKIGEAPASANRSSWPARSGPTSHAPRRRADLEVTIGDGTGRAIVIFTGRRKLPSWMAGPSGRRRRPLQRNQLTLLNPSYTLTWAARSVPARTYGAGGAAPSIVQARAKHARSERASDVSSADEDGADVVLGLVGDEHQHLVVAEQHGVASWDDDPVLAARSPAPVSTITPTSRS